MRILSASRGVAAAANEPTSGKPIQLIGIHAGASIIVHLRPAELWQEEPAAEELRICLEPLTGWAESHLKELCLLDAAAIESALVGLVLHPDGQPPNAFAVVRLVEDQSSQQLIEKLNLQRVDSFEQQVFENERCTVIIKDAKVFTVGPHGRAQEMADAAEFEQPTLASIEQLLEQTDDRRMLTVLLFRCSMRAGR